jgi:signal peptidase I
VLLALGGFADLGRTYRLYLVPTASMAPTVAPGNEIVATQSIAGEELYRGDLVLVDATAWQTSNVPAVMIRRIVGIGGDTLSCCDDTKRLLVNGREINEEYVGPDVPYGPPWTTMTFSATVPPDRYFLLGDQRNNAVDSRLSPGGTGALPASAIVGRVVAIRHGSGFQATPVTTAFTAAGLPGRTTPDTHYVYALAAIGIGAALIAGTVVCIIIIWTMVALVRRIRRTVS